jgi:hypothetical protein
MSPRAGAATSGYFLRAVFVDERLRVDFFAGTLPPSRRASDRPMAMACLRLVTFRPEEPERSVPRFLSCIAFSTFFEAFFPYFRPDDFLAFFAIHDLRASARHARGVMVVFAKSGPESLSLTGICYTPAA